MLTSAHRRIIRFLKQRHALLQGHAALRVEGMAHSGFAPSRCSLDCRPQDPGSLPKDSIGPPSISAPMPGEDRWGAEVPHKVSQSEEGGATELWAAGLPDLTGGGAGVYLARPAPGTSASKLNKFLA